jgi:hypothetical protein
LLRALEYVGLERAHNKYIDLDTMVVRNLPVNSVDYKVKPTYAHLPACIFGHMVKYQFSIQVNTIIVFTSAHNFEMIQDLFIFGSANIKFCKRRCN